MFLVARIFLIAVSLGALVSSAAMAQSAQSWEQILAAAKKEGTVSVIGPQGSETRDALTLAFQKKYPDIRVELQSMAGNQIGPKLFNELAAGRNSTDVLITGTTTALETLLPAKALVAVKPWLAGPNTQDPSKWRGGKLTFSDEAQSYNLVFSAYVKAPFIYNSQLVSGADFKSWKDLLEPKWQGKIALKDPVGAGGGLGNSTLWYSHEGLGKDFMRKMFGLKDLVMPRDDRQMLDFAARGKYPIAIGPSDVLTNEFIARGLPLKHLRPETLERRHVYHRRQWQPGRFRAARPIRTRCECIWIFSYRRKASSNGARPPALPACAAMFPKTMSRIFSCPRKACRTRISPTKSMSVCEKRSWNLSRRSCRDNESCNEV